MPTKRRRRAQSLRMQLTPALRRALELGKHRAWRAAGDVEGAADVSFFVTERELEALWRDHGAEVLAGWITEHPGARPWAWWQWEAREPRRVLAGAELLVHKNDPSDFEWVWRDHLGVPAFLQCRPRGYASLPQVESQASYLGRLKLFVGDERRRLTPEDFAPEEVDPFLIDEGELEELLAQGERRRAEASRQRAGAQSDTPQRNGRS